MLAGFLSYMEAEEVHHLKVARIIVTRGGQGYEEVGLWRGWPRVWSHSRIGGKAVAVSRQVAAAHSVILCVSDVLSLRK